MAQTVKLTYFKQSGKYYSEGTYTTEHELYHDFDIIPEVVVMRDNGNLPGLVTGAGKEFHIVVMAESEVPHLILSKSITNR